MKAPDGEGVLRVLVVDDNPVIRIGLRLLLAGTPDLEVVGEVADADATTEAVERLRPDVVLLDVRMPGRSGLDVLPGIAERTCVLMLTSSDEDEIIRQALARGARGYLVYGTVDEAGIVSSIRAAAGGGAVLSAGVTAALLRSGGAAGPAGPLPAVSPGPVLETAPATGLGPRIAVEAGLTERECTVMGLVAAGRSNAEIAATLYLAPKTVKNHLNRIFAKLHVSSRAQAMALWLGSVTRAAGPR